MTTTEQIERTSSAASSILTTYMATAGAAIFSFLNVLIVARGLGASGRGDVAFLNSVATLTALAGALSVQEANANLAGTRPGARRSLAGNSLTFAAALGSAAVLIVGGIIHFLPAARGEVSEALVWLVLLAVPLIILQNYLALLVRATYRVGIANLAMFAPPAVLVIANLTMLATGRLTVLTATVAWVGSAATGSLILSSYVHWRLDGFGRPNRPLARESVAFGVRAHGSAVLSFGSFRGDQWILGAVSGSRELGLYSIAVTWTETLFYLPTALSLALRPDLVRGSHEEASRRATFGLRVGLIVTVLLAAALVLGAPLLCIGVFGSEFSGSVADLQILAPGALGIVALKVLGSGLVARGRPLLDTAAVGVAFVLSLGLDAALIPSYGGTGAAVASSIAYGVAGIVVVIIFARAVGISSWDAIPGWDDVRTIGERMGMRSRNSSGSAPADLDEMARPSLSALEPLQISVDTALTSSEVTSATLGQMRSEPREHRVLRALRRSWWIVAWTTLVALAAGVAPILIDQPEYRARTSFIVGQDNVILRPDLGDSINAFTGTVRDLLHSDLVATSVIRERKLGVDPSTFLGRFSVATRDNSAVVVATYTDRNEQGAVDVLETTNDVFLDVVHERFGDTSTGTSGSDPVDQQVSVAVLDPPRAVGRVTGPQIRAAVLAVLAGVVVGIALAVLREIVMDRRRHRRTA